MRILTLLFSVLIIQFHVNAQTNVTFQNNVIKVNGTSIFPIGWYNVNEPDLESVKAQGFNVVLPLWHFLLNDNDRNKSADLSPGAYAYALERYFEKITELNEYLDDRRKIRVIVQIPDLIGDDITPFPVNDYINAIVVDKFINQEYLLGWYYADEPEQMKKEIIDGNVQYRYYESFQTLKERYDLIKSRDPNHIVFMCIANGYHLENFTPDPTPPYYDVLMHDHYCIGVGDPIPSLGLAEYDEWHHSLYHAFKSDGKTERTGSTMLVAQGYGLDNFRIPTAEEIKYEVFSALYMAQEDTCKVNYTWPNSQNAGGLMFWRYYAASIEIKQTISNFVNYFTNNSLDIIISQENRNNLTTDNQEKILTFTRFFDNAYYLFAINLSQNDNITTDFTINHNRLSKCDELIVGGSNNKILNKINSTQYKLTDVFRSREAKVYRLSSPIVIDKINIQQREYEINNYPNPFNPITTFSYVVPQTEMVELKVFNMLGQDVATIVNEVKDAGDYSVQFDASNLPSGIYIYEIKIGNFIKANKMILLK